MSGLHDAFTPDERALQRALVDAASQRFRAGGRFAWHFARGKLSGDPMFLALLRMGALPRGKPRLVRKNFLPNWGWVPSS